MSNLLPYYSNNETIEYPIECGLDESGAGCLAGPVVACAVIWPRDPEHCEELTILTDSKQLSAKKREILDDYIKYTAIDFSIGIVTEKEIDEMNILNARILAMHRAIDKLEITPNLLLVDGNQFKQYNKTEHKLIVKGDSKYQSIAAASILAKNERDQMMIDFHEDYPMYNWKSNKGYGSKDHYEAIKVNGLTDLHRKSFKIKLK